MNRHLGCLVLLLAAPLVAQDDARGLLGGLSLEQKAGQLFMSWSLSRAEGSAAQNHEKVLAWVRDVGLGGVILSLGTVADAANLIPKLQAAAKVPLLLAGDFEGGVWFRLAGACELGNQMLVGASGSAALAQAMGKVTAQEAKALGFHWVFAPVLDVNSNPNNPIINVRSFGEDPALVARLGAAFARGVRSEGLVACGKHFPGHGDVDSDSHLALPTVPGDGARLRAVELLPFRVAATEGLESVMTGHLAVPGLGEAPTVPATLSKHILGDVLRQELGFTGLVVTDALDMGGVKNAFPPGEVAVRALLAGADVLLMPPDPLAARDAVVAAVQSGRVPMARLDDAVRRILQVKERLGLLAPGAHGPAADWRAAVDTAPGRAVAAEIARRGLTLVRDPRGLLPLAADENEPWLVVDLTDAPGGKRPRDAAGDAMVGRLWEAGVEVTAHVQAGRSADEVATVVQHLAAARNVLIGLHVKVREYSGQLGLPPELQRAIGALREEQRVVFVSYGSPYLVRQLPATATYLCAYAGSTATERAVAAGLLGSQPITGRVPVRIPGVIDAGGGQSLLPGTGVATCAPSDEGLDAALPQRIDELLQRAIADRAFPGAVCLAARRGRVVAAVATGRHSYDEASPAVTLQTRYDLASLTKVCATTPAVLTLVAQGKLGLDDPVVKWLPAFTGPGKERVTLRHLLAHSSGLPAYERYYRTLQGEGVLAAAVKEGLMTEPGERVVYSDLGLMLTMAIVEVASGERFDRYVARAVWQPLGMTSACFAPADGPAVEAPPTETSAERGGLVQGRVHDENAWAMGGVSGHAGMFATADDVLRIGLLLLGGGRGVLPSPLVAAALQPQTAVGSTRALGLDLLAAGGFGGTAPAAGTFGHTGFTGTSLWCDPKNDLCVVLLTNRVHPTRVNGRIGAVRRQLHDLVLAAIER